MMNQNKYTINNRIEYINNRNLEVSRLRNSVRDLRDKRIIECIDTVFKSYKQSTVVNKAARYSKEKNIEYRGFRSIGLYQSIEVSKFFAKDYYWTPFFSDVGRAISRAERKYLHYRLGKHIRGVDEVISYSNLDFSILGKFVVELRKKNITPDVMLAPIQIYSEFVKKCRSELSESNWKTDQIRIEGCDLRILWSHRYAPLRGFIIFDSSAGIWHVIQDKDTEQGITIAIGKSQAKDNMIVYIVETMAYYEIVNKDAYIRVNLSH